MDDATTEYTDLRLKLSAFLRSSRHYTPEQLLSNPAFLAALADPAFLEALKDPKFVHAASLQETCRQLGVTVD